MQVNPTRMELGKTKRRLTTAVRGHKLLKDKQDEMARQFMVYIRRDRALRKEIGRMLAAAIRQFALAGAEMGEAALEEAFFIPAAAVQAEAGERTIMNLAAPRLRVTEGETASLPYGYAFTSERLDEAVRAVRALLPKLYELAEVEKTCDMLADEMERTRRRVNALEYVMIPGMRQTIRYISMKLEDNERGNLTRLMKVKEMMAAEEGDARA